MSMSVSRLSKSIEGNKKKTIGLTNQLTKCMVKCHKIDLHYDGSGISTMMNDIDMNTYT